MNERRMMISLISGNAERAGQSGIDKRRILTVYEMPRILSSSGRYMCRRVFRRHPRSRQTALVIGAI